ncbi:acyl-CoA thioesterase [Desulfobulbus rhabdoformis]|jgi:acyl-CoA thioester hydrolase|uniref:acyl-CoA thioesterase n=1 Tax=Desulfobulbus rhabdoformis TaxID=34032 RepID=UPI0019653599|nr:thioesterase family protein [Desulfobulbus rhabdoformis]MBM9616785.1 acyl-CoA thioesterase [Desulfobulbus rhabdoformis]
MYEITVVPKFGDVDGLGHVNNTILPRWFEQARNPVYKLFNPEFTFKNWNLILARFEVDFLSQIYLEHEVLIKTWISRIGSSSFEVYQEAHQKGRHCCKGKTTLVHFDFQNQRSVPISAELRAILQSHFKDLEPA